MATTASRRKSLPANGDYIPSQAIMDNSAPKNVLYSRRQGVEVGMPPLDAMVPPFPPAAPDVPKGPPVSYRNGAIPQYRSTAAGSFSARTREPPERSFQPANAENDQLSRDPRSQQPPYQQRPGQRRSVDPSVHRSPLQRLEVDLTGQSKQSKEEKRARVVEAEMRLREQISRRQSQRAAAEQVPRMATDRDLGAQRSSIDAPNSISGTPQSQGDIPRRSATIESRRHERDFRPTDLDRDHQGHRSVGRQPMVRQEGPAERLQYPAVQAAQEPQYAIAQSHQVGGIARAENASHQTVSNERNAAMPPTGGVVRNKLQKRPGPDYEHRRSVSYGDRQTRSAIQSDQLDDYNPVVASHELVDLNRKSVGNAEPPSAALLETDPGFPHNAEPEHGEYDGIPPTQLKTKRQTVSFDVPPPTPPPLVEWRQARVARLRLADRDFEHIDMDRGQAWWERGNGSNRRRSRALPKDYRKPPPQVNDRNRFNPPLFLKCGPLLRYLGMRRTNVDGPNGPIEQEIWRGSIMIVTTDSLSSFEPAPMLRLFSQPMEILPPPPRQISGDDDVQLRPEYVDPTAGLTKVGRDGRTFYVKPVDHLEEQVDLSQIESEDGLFESSPSPIGFTNDGRGQPVPSNRLHPVDGENSGLYEEIAGFRLYSDPARDVTFWRFNIEIELGDKQERIAYRVNEGPAIGFWVPGRGQSMNVMFHSCNGFSLSVDSNRFSGPDPLWRDVLNEHQTRPFHVMIGGGDQIYNDKLMVESDLFEEWTRIRNPHQKHHAPFSAAMKAEMETFYLNHYSMWFSQGLFGLANSQIPMVNMWDDHDIIDGYGSYPDHFMKSPVFSGLGNVAFKYYMLFQHQSVPEETEADEPSWLLGADPGPYIQAKSRSLFMSLGKGVALLGLDCRTERMRDEILTEQTYDLIWDRCHREIVKGETKHLIVVLGVPIAYPRLVWLENLLTSRVMDPVKALSRAGLFSGFVNKFDGSVEILDDLDDHWTSKKHKSERTWLIEDLQDLAAEKSIRVTILGGDVHLAAMGQFYSNPQLNLAKDKDYRYMPNIVSSAIVNAPPPEMLADVLNRRNKVHHMDSNTDEDMIPIFTHDVDGKSRNNKRLLPRRNWCSIREYHPGTTPPPTPPEAATPPTPDLKPGKLRRTLSLNRGDSRDNPRGGLLRRLSLRGPPPTKEFNLDGMNQRRISMDGSRPPVETGDSYFPSDAQRPGPFHRRPTNLSLKASKKAHPEGDDGVGSFVNLEGGLDITLNVEVNPKDPAGITTPYKLLIPALWYEGGYDDPQPRRVVKGWKKWLGRGRTKEDQSVDNFDGDADISDTDEGAPPGTQIPPHHPGNNNDHESFGDDDDELATPPPRRKKWFGVV